MYRAFDSGASDAAMGRSHGGNGPAERALVAQPCLVVLDAQRRLVQATPAAHRLLQGCRALTLIHGALCATDTHDGGLLGEAFRCVLSGGEPTRTVRLGKEEAALTVELALLRGEGGDLHVVATVRPMANRNSAQLASAIGRFGLTCAEARVLELLCAGASLKQAAERLGVARTTTRTHLQRIFDKSDTRRQSDLLRRVLAA